MADETGYDGGNKNCYIPIRDFGERGWSLFTASLLMSDRIDLWLPSGKEIEAAHQSGQLPFDQSDIIELIKSGFIKVCGREFNFDRRSDKALFGVEDTLLDNFLENEVKGGNKSNYIVLHEDYPGAVIARQEVHEFIDALRLRRVPNTDSHFGRALMMVQQQKDRDINTDPSMLSMPSIVRVRSKFFQELEVEDIKDKDLRDAYSLISGSHLSREEASDCSLAIQAVRLSIEHSSIKKSQNCAVHTAEIEHANVYSFVSKDLGVSVTKGTDPEIHILKAVELLAHLLDLNEVRSVPDFLERHKSLAEYRDTIWRLTRYSHDFTGEVADNLRAHLKEQNTLGRIFGKGSAQRLLSGGSIADTLIGAAMAAFDGGLSLVSRGVFSAGLAVSTPVYNYVDQSRTPNKHLWPAVATFKTQRPTRRQLTEVLHDIEYFARTIR